MDGTWCFGMKDDDVKGFGMYGDDTQVWSWWTINLAKVYLRGSGHCSVVYLFVGECAVTSVHLSAEVGGLCTGLWHGVYNAVGSTSDACCVWDCTTSWLGSACRQSSCTLQDDRSSHVRTVTTTLCLISVIHNTFNTSVCCLWLMLCDDTCLSSPSLSVWWLCLYIVLISLTIHASRSTPSTNGVCESC